ncbi:hypothetical protein [Salinisphaera sp. Q1T1-3]|uniref:hypothetical protein n=1 Tax=Salinisphaera sp. Q1T1-3 TaxID=2321229 RepID=UPI000E744341|nr:hypothetical protein [Salinisphaera sp. Q1T1-3]RJS92509.1 hypothetical protein D3260_11300 [Salinisphaera sp. Q1T1-3]
MNRSRKLVLAAAMLCAPFQAAFSAAPGGGSQPQRAPAYIRLGPMPAHPARHLTRQHRSAPGCAPPGALYIANQAQNYPLHIVLRRRAAPSGGPHRFETVLAPQAVAVRVGCDAAAGAPGHWQRDRVEFVIPKSDRTGP